MWPVNYLPKDKILLILFIKALNTFRVSSHISTAHVCTDIFYKGQLNVMLYKKDYIYFHMFNRLLIEKYKSIGQGMEKGMTC